MYVFFKVVQFFEQYYLIIISQLFHFYFHFKFISFIIIHQGRNSH